MVRKTTSLTTDDQLWRAFKIRAAELGLKLSVAMDQAQREWLQNHPKPKEAKNE